LPNEINFFAHVIFAVGSPPKSGDNPKIVENIAQLFCPSGDARVTGANVCTCEEIPELGKSRDDIIAGLPSVFVRPQSSKTIQIVRVGVSASTR
jgi:hypothetical protein